MNLKFEYDKVRDAWCILNFGKTSINSDYVTEMYKMLENTENLDQDLAEEFISQYIDQNEYSIDNCIKKYIEIFESIKDGYIQIAERVFKVRIDYDITAYLTLNQRYPYGIDERLFFVPFLKNYDSVSNLVIMHELWHFYTWSRFDQQELDKIGPEKYNIVKESLTAILNVECKHLLNKGELDRGYPQHKELREKILEWWTQDSDIEFVWDKAVNYLN